MRSEQTKDYNKDIYDYKEVNDFRFGKWEEWYDDDNQIWKKCQVVGLRNNSCNGLLLRRRKVRNMIVNINCPPSYTQERYIQESKELLEKDESIGEITTQFNNEFLRIKRDGIIKEELK